MTVAAVAVLQTITRDEFEQDWNGSEDFDWIDGRPWDDPPVDPVKEIVVELEGKSYAFPAKDVIDAQGNVIHKGVISEINDWADYFRWEIENEGDEEEEPTDFHFRWENTEEAITEQVWERVHRHFFAQLDTPAEAEAVITCRGEYFVKGFEELVAMFSMIGERIPELRPTLLAKLQEAHDQTVAVLQHWIDEYGEAGAETE